MVIRNCHIIDCTGRTPYLADVRIENGSIIQIGENLEGTTLYDAQGGWLLPGLVNLHVHINRRNLSRGTGVFRQGAPAIENSSDGVRRTQRRVCCIKGTVG